MKQLIYILAIILFSSCITERKANNWFNQHKRKAAAYCHVNFPVDTTNKVEFKFVDSSAYHNAYLNVSHLADSLFFALDSVTHIPGKPYRPNIDSLRKVVDKEIRTRLTPCVDSVVYIKTTVVDHAREAILQGLLDEKDQINTKQQQIIQRQNDKIIMQRKWFWLFWGLVVLIALYVFAKIKFKLSI
jgi:hypothetical protein